jgi:hypothetical protein
MPSRAQMAAEGDHHVEPGAGRADLRVERLEEHVHRGGAGGVGHDEQHLPFPVLLGRAGAGDEIGGFLPADGARGTDGGKYL